MCRPTLIFCAFALLIVATAYSQRVRIIHPTYRPPARPRYPIIRTAREVDGGNRLEEVRQLPAYVETMETRREARSLSTPGRGRASSSSTGSSSRGHDTGPTHPGYNRRNAREAGDELAKNEDALNRWSSTKDDRYDVDPSFSHAGYDTESNPGYNRRDTRSLHLPTLLPPFNPRPRPWNPPRLPIPMPQRPRLPIYV